MVTKHKYKQMQQQLGQQMQQGGAESTAQQMKNMLEELTQMLQQRMQGIRARALGTGRDRHARGGEPEAGTHHAGDRLPSRRAEGHAEQTVTLRPGGPASVAIALEPLAQLLLTLTTPSTSPAPTEKSTRRRKVPRPISPFTLSVTSPPSTCRAARQ